MADATEFVAGLGRRQAKELTQLLRAVSIASRDL
jgi:hypothetical protein